MLTDNLLFLHLLRDDIQKEIFHHLSRDGDEADWPVVPWVILQVTLELIPCSLSFVLGMIHIFSIMSGLLYDRLFKIK